MKWALNFGGFSFFADKKKDVLAVGGSGYGGIRDPVFISGGYRVASEGFLERFASKRPLWNYSASSVYCQQDVAGFVI